MTGELSASLPRGERELLMLLGFSEFLCCLSVARRERAAGRVCVPEGEAERAAGLIGSMGLHCHRSAFDLLPRPDFHEGKKVSHHAVYVAQNSRPGAHAVLYFALDAEFARGAESAELSREQRLTARLFGYPECCAEFFSREDGFNQDRTSGAVADAGPHPAILNPLLPELYGVRLTFHFACSPRCRRSYLMAKARLEWLKKLAPSAAEVERLGAGIALYGPSTGASLVTRYEPAGPDSYFVEEVTTWGGAREGLFSGEAPALLRLHSARRFEVNGRVFDDGLHFAAVFSEPAAGPAGESIS
ncbi:MAG TPA: hypothetical protein VGB98_08720 [Pyrinomonadaceae bacterium]|jgi:hypothetical protein